MLMPNVNNTSKNNGTRHQNGLRFKATTIAEIMTITDKAWKRSAGGATVKSLNERHSRNINVVA